MNIFFNFTIEDVLSSCEWYYSCFWCSSGRSSMCLMTLHVGGACNFPKPRAFHWEFWGKSLVQGLHPCWWQWQLKAVHCWRDEMVPRPRKVTSLTENWGRSWFVHEVKQCAYAGRTYREEVFNGCWGWGLSCWCVIGSLWFELEMF